MLSGYFCWPCIWGMCISFFHMFSGMLGQSRSLFTQGAFPKIKNACEEAKAIVKIEAVFFIIFKPNYRDLI